MKTTFNKLTFALIAAFALIVSTASATWVHVNTYSGSYGSEVTWDLVDASGTSLLTGGPYSSGTYNLDSVDLPDPGCYDLNMYDSWGDGWNGAYVEIIDPGSGTVMYTIRYWFYFRYFCNRKLLFALGSWMY